MAETPNNLVCLIQYNLISPIVQLSCAISICWCIRQYIKAKETISNKISFYMGLFLFILQLFYFLFETAWNVLNCRSDNKYRALLNFCYSTSDYLVGFQYLLLFYFMFHRLKIVFRGTAFQLSQCSVRTFIGLYTSLIAVGSFNYFSISYGPPLYDLFWPITAPILALLAMSLLSMLSFLFVYKLVSVNKQIDGGNEYNVGTKKVLANITKISLLMSISIASYLPTGSLAALQGIYEFGPWLIWLVHMIINVDVYTNFVCIFLSFQHFKKYYYRGCGCCDAKCRQLCQMCVGGGKRERKSNDTELNNKHLVSVDTMSSETEVGSADTPSTKESNSY